MEIKELLIGKNGTLRDGDGNKVEAKPFGQPVIRSVRVGKNIFPAWIIAGIPSSHLEPKVEVVGYVIGTPRNTEEGVSYPVQFYADYSKMWVNIPFDFCERLE